MKKALITVLVVVMGLSLMGLDCFGGGGKSPYFPLAEGNKLEYEGTQTTTMDYPEGEYMPADTSWAWDVSAVTEVIGETTLPGNDEMKVWEVKSTSVVDTFTTESTSYVKVENDSIYTYDKDGVLSSTYPADPKVGDTWKQGTINFKVEADGKEANGYTGCLEISMTPDDISGYDTYSSLQYWAKDVGVVLMNMNTVMKTAMGADTMVTTIDMENKLINKNF